MVVNSSAIHAVLWGMRISSGFKRWSWQNYWAVTTGSPRRNPWPAWERCSGEEKQKADASRAGQEKRRMISGVMRWERERERGVGFVCTRCTVSGALCASTPGQNAANSKIFAVDNLLKLEEEEWEEEDMAQFHFQLQQEKDEVRAAAEGVLEISWN